MTSSGSHRRTSRTRVAYRRRGLRLLGVVGAAVTMSSFMQPLTVGAILPAAPETPEPPPTPPPVEETTTTAAPAPTEVPTTPAPSTTSAEPSTTTPEPSTPPLEPTTSLPIATTVPETSVPESSTTTSSTTTTTLVPVANITLAPLCTAEEDFDAGTRTFRVDNNAVRRLKITLQNVESGGSVSGTAPPGQSMWDVPAGGARTRPP